MARTVINHSCEMCGAIRQVSPDKLAKGLQKVCRKCQGKSAAHKRSVAMLARGGPRHVTYAACTYCKKDYQMAAMDDDGLCSDRCRTLDAKRGKNAMDLYRMAMFGVRAQQ